MDVISTVSSMQDAFMEVVASSKLKSAHVRDDGAFTRVACACAPRSSLLRALLAILALFFVFGVAYAQSGLIKCPFQGFVPDGNYTQAGAYQQCQAWLSNVMQSDNSNGFSASTVVPCTLYLDSSGTYSYEYCAEVYVTGNGRPPGFGPWCSGWNGSLLYTQPAKNLGRQCPCARTPITLQAGDPINVITGNEYRDEEDASLGVLSLHRYYNSDASMAFSHTGMHWRHSFDRNLVYEPGNTPATATIIRPDGVQKIFQLLATGQWAPDADVPDTLTEQTNASGGLTGWIYFDASTRSYESYDANGNLQSIKDPNGWVTALTYSTTSTPASIAPSAGLLLTVTDPRGRALGFTYNAQANIATAKLPDGGQLVYGYDVNENLVTVTYPDNNVKKYVYNESAFNSGVSQPYVLTGIIDESSTRFSSIGYNGQGQAIQSFLGTNIDLTSVSYGSNGSSTVTYSTGAQTTFTPTLISNSIYGSSLTAPCGPLCGQTIQSVAYDANGYPASATDFKGNLTTTHYDNYGLLKTQVDASGSANQRTSSTQWNDTLRVPLLHTVQDASGNTVAETSWVYNAIGQPTARCEIDPALASGYTCAASGSVPTGVRRWAYSYCTAINAQCPLVGLLLNVTGPRTDLTQTTSYSYYMSSSATNCGTPGAACYQKGDVYQITDALGHTTTIASYDADGRVTRITDANGVNTDLTYTPRGWLASRTVGGAVTTLTYEPYGEVHTLTDPDGVVTTFKHDPAHRLTDILDAQGNDLHYKLDLAGNKILEQVSNASGTVVRSLTRNFNALGQLTTMLDGLNHTVFSATYSDSYDANGNLMHSVDGNGYQRYQNFDALNRLSSTLANYNGSDPATSNTKTQISLDALDRVSGVTDPTQLSTAYAYDGLSNRTGLQSPDTGTSTDTYDAAGNRITHTDAKGIASTSTYDALDRLISTSYPSDPTQNVTYNYDQPNTVTGCTASNPVGRLTSVVEATFSTMYCYDSRGNVIQKLYVTSGTTDITTYTYTMADRLSSYATPFVNFVNFSSDHPTKVSYTYDTDGRISGVKVSPTDPTSTTTPVFGQQAPPPALGPTTVVSNVTWMPFGPISSYTLGNGQVITRTYDANYRLTDLTSPALTLHFARDAMGDITGIGNAPGANPATENYVYDPLYRLQSVSDSGNALAGYTYDQTGDRLTETGNGLAAGIYGYATGTHQLSSLAGIPQANDPNGNTTGRVLGSNSYGYHYNARNRPDLVQLNGTTVGTYTYNALGERIGKVATYPQSVTARYAYDEAGHLIGEYGTIDRDYVWLGDLPVAIVDDGIGSSGISTISYIVADQLNTPRVVSNSAGTVIWQWAYQGNPFGEQQPTSSTGYVLNLRYPGQYYDVEIGLNYNVNRHYEPVIGGYDQPDPLGLAAGPSLYAYVDSDPLNFIDPLGTSKLQGTNNIGGNDPLTPRLNAQSNPDEVKRAIKAAEEAERSGALNANRLRQVRAWLKVAKRNFTRAECPPLFFEVLEQQMGQLCEEGNPIGCSMYQGLGGTVIDKSQM